MGKLLAGSAPLRVRPGLELLVPTLDYRLARELWGIGDLRAAVLTNAIVGGTPAYLREFAQVPDGPGDFDPWVCRTVLNQLSTQAGTTRRGQAVVLAPALAYRARNGMSVIAWLAKI